MMLSAKLKTSIIGRGASAVLAKRWSSTIPFDPTILLGNIVNPKKFDTLEKIGKYQAEIDSKQDELNSILAAKNSLEMTKQEVAQMGIDPNDSDMKSVEKSMDDDIKKTVADYAKTQVKNLPLITQLKAGIATIEDHVESPLDYNKSLLKKDLAISSNTIKLNSQYFTFTQNQQESEATILQAKAFAGGEVSRFGDHISTKVSSAVQSQMTKQIQENDISGTLVITATCTHANASLFAPFVIDVDKAINAWNASFPDDQMNDTDKSQMEQLALKDDSKNSLNIVSGATYGSCFVGMVHHLRQSSTQNSESMLSTAASMTATFDVGAFFSHYSGGFGVDGSFSKDLKALLSSEMVTSHVSVICEGCIPTIASNKVALGVKTFAQFDPAATMEKLATMHNSNNNSNATVASAADEARQGKTVASLRENEVKSTMSALSKIDEEKDSVLNINSLVSALEDYVTEAKKTSIGVPINFFLKNITKSDLAKMWIEKYVVKAPKAAENPNDKSDDGKKK